MSETNAELIALSHGTLNYLTVNIILLALETVNIRDIKYSNSRIHVMLLNDFM